MLRLIGRRLLLMIPTLILASILIFALAEVLPGDVGRSILGPYATQEQVEILNKQLGADKPLYERYLTWAGNFVTGDWGESLLLKVPVFPTVMKALGNSLVLAAFALIVIVPTSILLGVWAGLRRDSLLDRTITIQHALDDRDPRVRLRRRPPLRLRRVAQVAAGHGHAA